MADKTLFSKIIDREIPAQLLHEDDRCVAFADIDPKAPVHFLVVPKKPLDRIENMQPEDEALVGHLMFVATQVAKAQGLEDGYRLVMNNGALAGQTVFHIHLHVLGGRAMSWPPG